jgi:molybdenum cofactor synthesis domain-containing protein
MTDDHAPSLTAAVLLIGDELLSGRTQDSNLAYIARFLAAYGIDVCEARVVRDREEEIAEALNALRGRYTYVFTTGGIGPTHDDITADAVGRAFGVPVEYRPEALALLAPRYKPGEFNDMRRRLARVPEGPRLSATASRSRRASRLPMCSFWPGCR